MIITVPIRGSVHPVVSTGHKVLQILPILIGIHHISALFVLAVGQTHQSEDVFRQEAV